jgi:hypothetical protein
MGRSGDPRKRAAGAFVGLGQMVEANPARQASARRSMDEEITEALATHSHYWLAIAQHRLTDASARIVVGLEAGSPNLDTESLRGVDVGCFICEQQVSPLLIGGRCPGDPTGYSAGIANRS